MALPNGWRAVGDALESGQAWVYPAVRESTAEKCALKMLKNPRRRDRFVREVEAMQSLRDVGCECIPPIVALDLSASRPWYAMPWYEDGSLEQHLPRVATEVEVESALNLAISIATALADVHAAGFSHRDMKPANVLLSGQTVLLADFGLCLEFDDETRLTELQEAIGSRFYIAPENEGGINEETDQRPADFYAFGKILWILLVGGAQLPREQALEPEHQMARVLGDVLLEPLDRLLRDLLNRDPRVRLHDWEVVLADLNSVRRMFIGESPEMSPRPPGENLLNVARRLRDSPIVAASLEARESSDRSIAWFSLLDREMHSADRYIELAFREVTAALDGLLTITGTSGSPPSSEMIEAFGVSHEDAALLAVPAVRSTTSQPVFMIHSPRGLSQFPTICIRMWSVVIDQSVWLMAVPTTTLRQGRDEAAVGLGRWFYRRLGPFPILRQATIDEAVRLVHELARLFAALAERYVFAVEASQDVGIDSFWEAQELTPVEDAMETNEGSLGDTKAPDLRTFELSPSTIELGAEGGAVTCRARLVDDDSGIAGAGFSGSPSQARLRSPSGQLIDAMFTDSTRVRGDAHDSVHECQLRFSSSSERGRWEVEYVLLVDQVGNSRRYGPSDLRLMGFDSNVQVK